MIIAPRERKTVVPFELEFCEYLQPYVPKKKSTAKATSKAPKKVAAAKKVPKKAVKVPATGLKKKTSGLALAGKSSSLTGPAAFAKRVALARSAPATLTRQESATAQKLAGKGSETHKWQFVADNGKWCDYSPLASVEVEKQYASWVVNPHIDVRCVASGDWEYMVDFNAMQQQNIKHHNHRIRKVQRVALAKNQV